MMCFEHRFHLSAPIDPRLPLPDRSPTLTRHFDVALPQLSGICRVTVGCGETTSSTVFELRSQPESPKCRVSGEISSARVRGGRA